MKQTTLQLQTKYRIALLEQCTDYRHHDSILPVTSWAEITSSFQLSCKLHLIFPYLPQLLCCLMTSREFCRCFLRNYLTGLNLQSWKPRGYGKRKRKLKWQLRTFNMFSSLIHRKAVWVILTPGWGLEDLSVTLDLHLWKNKFTLKISNFPIKLNILTSEAISDILQNQLCHEISLTSYLSFLTDSPEQLQPFLTIQNMRTVRRNQVSVIFILLVTKRPFKTLFSFNSKKKR